MRLWNHMISDIFEINVSTNLAISIDQLFPHINSFCHLVKTPIVRAAVNFILFPLPFTGIFGSNSIFVHKRKTIRATVSNDKCSPTCKNCFHIHLPRCVVIENKTYLLQKYAWPIRSLIFALVKPLLLEGTSKRIFNYLLARASKLYHFYIANVVD